MRQLTHCRTALLVLGLCSANSAQAQTVAETMEVRVTNVDVVVVDREGNPVHGLTRDDFTLLENGRRVEISNFYEERADVAVSDAPADSTSDTTPQQPGRKPRRLVIFLDESSLLPHERDRALEHLVDLIEETIDEGDQAMIASFNNGLTLGQPFTSDHELLVAAIESFRDSVSNAALNANRFRTLQNELIQQIEDATGNTGGGGGVQGMVQVAPATYSGAMGEVRQYAQEQLGRNNRIMAALESIVVALGGLEGRRSIVFVTNALSRNPGIEALELMEAIKDRFEGGTGNAPRLESQRFTLEKEFRELTERASSVGVVVHALQGGGGAGQMMGADMDVPGPWEAASGAIAGIRAGEKEMQQSMRELAGATGGIALVESSNIAGALDRIAGELQSHYSLGYRSTGERGATRRIEVKVRQPGLTVRHPGVIVDRSIEQEMEDRIATVLNFPDTAIGYGVTTSLGGASPAAGGKMQVPLTINIPTENLTLMPEGEQLVGAFSVHSGFLNDNGAISKVTVQQQEFRFPAESRSRRNTITLQLMMTLDPTVERVAIAVVDRLSQLAQVAVQEVTASDQGNVQ